MAPIDTLRILSEQTPREGGLGVPTRSMPLWFMETFRGVAGAATSNPTCGCVLLQPSFNLLFESRRRTAIRTRAAQLRNSLGARKAFAHATPDRRPDPGFAKMLRLFNVRWVSVVPRIRSTTERRTARPRASRSASSPTPAAHSWSATSSKPRATKKCPPTDRPEFDATKSCRRGLGGRVADAARRARFKSPNERTAGSLFAPSYPVRACW
jgi:hypothetical protein